MPQDTFQIALEHHRSGRLRQAEAGYRALLADDPDHADAAHWLGVLLAQAGQFDAAATLLRLATDLRPTDAAFQHNLAHALMALGRPGEAAEALERAVEAEPGRTESLVALARAYLARNAFGDADGAVDALRRARDAGGDDSPELHHDLGVALLAAEQPDGAIAALRTAVEKRPAYASALYYLALAHRAKRDAKEVRKYLNRALEADPGHARAWHALAALDAEAGNLEVAAGLFRKAIRAKADYGAAYEGLSAVLTKLGRRTEAAAAGIAADRLAGRSSATAAAPVAATPVSVGELEDRITPTAEGQRLQEAVAVKLGLPPPPRVSTVAVTELFDRYADRFDAHLREKLEYRIPEQMAAAVAAAAGPGRPPMDVLDLGCGTGLCGPFFRPMARSLAGVDLSPKMLEKAAARGAYDRLEAGELVEVLRREPAAYDLLVAADVLIYFGDLAPVFEAAAAALRPGGLLAYSVEAGEGDRFTLNADTRRYTHAAVYLKRLAAMYGFAEASFAEVTGRVQAHRPVPSYLVVLRGAG